MATKKVNTDVSGAYTADDMRELSGLEPIRQSPAQYIGDINAVSQINGKGRETDGEVLTAGGMHLFVEACGNASDEATNKGPDGKTYANQINITLHKDQSITIQDNGRGVPPDINKATGKSGMEMAFLTMNAGGKFKDKTEKKAGNYKSAQGLHGVGAACIAALSDRLDVTVWRDGKEYNLSAKKGDPGTFDKDGLNAKFTPAKPGKSAVVSGKDSRKAAEKKGWETGTRVHWHPDPLIWNGTDIPIRDIYEYVEAQSYMAPAATYRIIDETGIQFDGHLGKCGSIDKDGIRVSEFHKPGGIEEMIEEKTAKTTNLSPVINFDIPAKYSKKVSIEDDDGKITNKEIEYDCEIKVALRWTSKNGIDIEGYANGVHCVGNHLDGFRRGMSRGVGNWIKKSNIMTKQDEKNKVNVDILDITEGMIAAVEVLLEDQCLFNNQVKEKLTNSEVTSCVSDAVKEQIEQWMSAKKNATVAKRICKSIVDNARLRNKQKNEKENAKKIKEKLNGLSSKPAKLYDCKNEGPGTELVVCEGDSALGSIIQARDGLWQSAIGLKGISLNTYEAKKDKILSNAEFADIISAMNAKGIGSDFDYENRRYDRIGIYTDADEDGNYIRSLLLVFIYTCFPGMIENGKVFAGIPPLYEIIYKSGVHKGEQFYAQDEAARDKFIEDYMKKGGNLEHLSIIRSKGLGAMDPDDFIQCLDPKTRHIRIITVDEIGEIREQADEAFKLLFGKDDESKTARRQWIDNTFQAEDE